MDRASIWNKDVIEKIVNTMTKENAAKMILEFLPEPVADKFAILFGITVD